MSELTRKLLWTAGAGALCVLSGKAILHRSRRFGWKDRSVIITGGSRGLGLVLARQLVQEGAKVAICARSEAELYAAGNELRDMGGQVLAIRCDVGRPEEVQEMVDAVMAYFGTVDVLFNVAGVMQVGPLDSMTATDFQQAMNTHCWGPLYCSLAVLPEMRRRSWGRIVNVASIGGKQAVPHMLPYTTSKFALVGLSHGLRTELARENILVTTVCPNLMRTGSPRNAIFKGQNTREYAWFSISDSLPFVSLRAEKAAHRILRACQNGENEVIVGNRANPAGFIVEWFPHLTDEIMALINLVLPDMGGIGRTPARGYESESKWSESWLTTLGREAAVGNNEMHQYQAAQTRRG